MPDAVAYQVNPGHSGAQAGPFGNHLVESWDRQIPAAFPVLYPLVVHGRVFVTYGGNDTFVLALDAHSGRTLWGPVALHMTKAHGWARGYATFDGGRLFVLADDGTLEALNPTSGGVLWRIPAVAGNTPGYWNQPPTASGGIVFTVGINNNRSGEYLFARRESDGHVLWSRPAFGYEQGPAASGQYVVFPTQGCEISRQPWVFRAATGATVWSGSCGQNDILNTPAVTAGAVAMSGDNHAAAAGTYALATGARSSTLYSEVTPAFAGSQLVGRQTFTTTPPSNCVQQYVFGQQISASTSQWRVPVPGEIGLPLVIGAHVIVRTDDSYRDSVWEINRSTGAIESEVPTDAPGDQPLNDALYQTMNAGDGVLVVPGYSSLMAFSSTTSASQIGQSQPYVATASLPSGTVAQRYGDALGAGGGACPYTWSLVGGELPPGLSLGSTGTISGTPTAPGTYTFTVQVTDAQGLKGQRELSIQIDS